MDKGIFGEFKKLASGIIDENDLSNLKDFFDKLSERYGADFQFTDLQKSAICSPGFWKEEHNNLILGATSSGKTLIAEISMAYQIFCKEKKVIYLVPLKVLTTEKRDHFLKDFEDKKVYISSSDYQEHDYELQRGDYDIGVLVYEKFFSLLAENSKKFLENCSLVVIDEMHMLKTAARGPKLEFSIEKLRFNKEHSPSVLGLTTSEFDVTQVQKWLGEDKTSLIESNERPIKIEERFIYCDGSMEKAVMRSFINGEEQQNTEPLPVNNNYYDHDIQLFELFQVMEAHPKEHIIIFCNGKRKSVNIVKELCSSGILKNNYVRSEKFPDIVDTDMEEADYNEFKDHLERYSIAYHNADLTLELREFIESEFGEGKIRIIVATETLTMGINTPTDIMILYDNTVFRGEERPEQMDYADYKNAIGRAGRLGMTQKGISYMLIPNDKDKKNFENTIKKYALPQSKKPVISSSIPAIYKYSKEDPKKMTLSMLLTPFYLNLLNNGSFKSEAISKMLSSGFGDYGSESDISMLSDEIMGILSGKHPKSEKIKLPRLAAKDQVIREFEEDEDSDSYVITDFGKKLSPFALSIGTNNLVSKHFVKEPKFDLRSGNGFFLDPEKAADDTSKNYFLDVMYIVCNLREIKENTNYLRVPNNPEVVRGNIKKSIRSFLKNKVNKETMLWENSRLKELCAGDSDIEEDALPILYRTVVLYYWVQGLNVRDIRRELGLPDKSEYYIYTNEVESLGELCAYQLEAISRVVKNKDNSDDDDPELNKKLREMFYKLSIRVKYGMSNDLSRIANKHIRGLTRARLLKIEKLSKEKNYLSITEFILNNGRELEKLGVSEAQYAELKRIMNGVLKYDEEHLKDDVERTALVNSDFWAKYNTIIHFGKDTLQEIANLFNDNFRIPFSRSSPSDRLGEIRTDNKLITLFLCFDKKHYTSVDEMKKENPAEDKDVLYICKSADPISKNEPQNYMTIRNFCILLLRVIAHSNSDDLTAAGRHFADLLFERVHGTDINDSAVLEKTLSCPEPCKAVSADTVNNNNTTYNIYNIQNTQINQINQTTTINNNFVITINNVIENLREKIGNIPSDDESYEAELERAKCFDEAAEKIEQNIQPPKDLDARCREITNGETDPDYDELLAAMTGQEKLIKYMRQAIYVKSVVEELEGLDDYSPAVIFYGKALELCLYKKLNPIFRSKTPDISMFTDPKKRNKDWTLGTFTSILSAKFINTDRNHKEHDLYENMDEDQRRFWRNLYDLVNKVRTIRNKASHKGKTVSRGEVNTIHENSKKIIMISAEDLAPYLP